MQFSLALGPDFVHGMAISLPCEPLWGKTLMTAALVVQLSNHHISGHVLVSRIGQVAL